MASFRGKFYAGYSGGYNKRNYIDENIRNISKQIDSLNGAKIVCSSYQELIIPNNSIIYCDIPYKNTTGYSFSEEFNHEDFWQWCRKMAKQNHEIFVSEYSAPDDFTCVWQKYIKNTLGTNSSYETIQKLWKINKE
jgi:DNA adenine methylase